MADIWTVTAQYIPTSEPVKIQVEYESTAKGLKELLEEHPNVKDADYRQTF